jgi:sugar lactone lactonase YvrE
MTANPLRGFTVDRTTIGYIGHDLQRPECILAEPNGDLWSADARGGLVHIRADGMQRLIGQTASGPFTQETLPNGLAFTPNGDILISNFGTDRLEIMTRAGETRVLHDRIDGQPIGKVNFVLRDSKDRVWITVSTRVNPWTTAATSRVRDGFVAVADARGLRVVADGFSFANEIRFDANEEWLYIVESTGPHVTRMRARESADGEVRLTDREIFGPAHLGGLPDGIAFDAYGNLWCTLVMIDQLVAITPEGDRLMLLDDSTPAGHELMRAFDSGRATAEMMLAAAGSIAPWMASVTFGGADLRTVYIGSLRGTRIPFFRSPVPGLPMVHWARWSASTGSAWSDARQ